MNQDIHWSALVPELTVTNLERSLAFYTALGFSIRFRRDNPPFAYLEIGQAQLMLEQQHETGWNVAPLDRPLGRGVNFQIEVPDAQIIESALRHLGAPLFRERSHLRRRDCAISCGLFVDECRIAKVCGELRQRIRTIRCTLQR